MGIISKARSVVAELIGGKSLRESIFNEAYESPFVDEMGGDLDDYLYTRLGDRMRRDLSSERQERQLKIVYWLYLGYPIAKRALEITRNFIVGDGLSFTAEDKTVQKVLDDFWLRNNMRMRQNDMALEIGMYGEQFYPVGVNQKNGAVVLGYLDPLEVTNVVTLPTNIAIPDIIEIGEAPNERVDYSIDVPSRASKGQNQLKVIRRDTDINAKTWDLLNGDCFFFATNKVSNASRGNSDLLSAIDWLETHEQFLMTIHEAAVLKTSVLWDILVEGADDKKIKELQRKYSAIKSGTTRWHNEKMKIEAVVPELNSSDLTEHASTLKRHICTAIGYPEHWLSEGSNANRATAAEMGVPATKNLKARQNFFLNMLSTMFDFSIDQAIAANRLNRNVNRSFEISAPQIWVIDTQKIANSLSGLCDSLIKAVNKGWISDADAGKTYRFVAKQLGISMDEPKNETGKH